MFEAECFLRRDMRNAIRVVFVDKRRTSSNFENIVVRIFFSWFQKNPLETIYKRMPLRKRLYFLDAR